MLPYNNTILNLQEYLLILKDGRKHWKYTVLKWVARPLAPLCLFWGVSLDNRTTCAGWSQSQSLFMSTSALVTREGIPSGLPRGFRIALRHALYSDREFGGKKEKWSSVGNTIEYKCVVVSGGPKPPSSGALGWVVLFGQSREGVNHLNGEGESTSS